MNNIEMNKIEMKHMEMNKIEMNHMEMNHMEMNRIEMNKIFRASVRKRGGFCFWKTRWLGPRLRLRTTGHSSYAVSASNEPSSRYSSESPLPASLSQ